MNPNTIRFVTIASIVLWAGIIWTTVRFVSWLMG